MVPASLEAFDGRYATDQQGVQEATSLVEPLIHAAATHVPIAFSLGTCGA